MPDMDYSKLLGRIKECGYTQKSLAKAVKMSESQLSQKICNNYAFRQTEIERISEELGIPAAEIGAYFFKKKVEKPQQLIN